MGNTFDEMLGTPVLVTEEILNICQEKGTFSGLAFDLYKEAGTVISVCTCLHIGADPEVQVFRRNQAICTGLLVRISKFMLAVIQLSAETNRCEVVMALSRCIMESATNLRYLIHENNEKVFDDFVRSGLGPEREQYEIITENIKSRNGQILPIEKRMLTSIDNLCKTSGLKIEDVPLGHRGWGKGMRARLEAVVLEFRV